VINNGNIGLKPLKEKSIAVLPFHNDSPDPDNAYICRGIEDELRNQLLSINDLKIIGRQEVEKYTGDADKELAAIGSELNVSYIISGSVRKVEDDIRIIVQLYDTKTGELLWGDAYQGEYSDELFLFQSNIANQIASVVNAVITPEEEQQLTKRPTISITAYDYILRARDEQWKYWYFKDTVAEKNAERFYDKALQLDPNYAVGWARRGSIYYDLHVTSQEYYENYYLDSVLWYCGKARQLDPESPASYNLEAMVYHKKGDIKSAIHSYKKAIINSSGNKTDIEPQETMWRLGTIYIYNKEYQKGISLIRKAVPAAKDSPKNYAHILFRLAYGYLWLGDYEEAEKYYLQSRDMGAGFYGYPYLYFYQGDFQDALKCLMDFNPNPSQDWDLCLLGNIYFQLGDFKNAVNYYRQYREFREARGLIQWNNLYREGIALIELGMKEEGMKLIEKQLSQLEKRKQLGRPDGYNYHLAAIAAYFGEQEKALQYLQEYRNQVFFPDHIIIPIYFTQYDILFKPLWNHPGFKVLLKQEQEEKETGRTLVRKMVESGDMTQ
jgi:TolB-like protein/Tfp pilus assembly protein PilF